VTLDPVHFDGITRLAGRISRDVDRRDHRAFAETVWSEFLDPLVRDGETVVEPLGDHRRRAADLEAAALQERPYPTQHGLDSGTINPTTYKNGIVLDVAQAAMTAVPSDLELHRDRTVVMTLHSNDATLSIPDDGWVPDDEGYTRKRVLRAPQVNRYEAAVVHELALYLAEGKHARANADVVDDLLILDGPIYPKGIHSWSNRQPELAALLAEDDRPQDVIENYLRLVERFVARDVPLVGFVKTPTSRLITRTIREETGDAPWVNDAALFSQLLERREDGRRLTDALTFTGWFVSRGGTDAMLSAPEGVFGLERELAPEAYALTFCAIYDPRTDTVYRLEAPAAFTRDADRRERLLRQVLAGVAAQKGPPEAVAKADSLARIGRRETRALQDALEATFDSERDTTYDEDRWGLVEQ